jgi:hypothetical protein
LHYFLSLFKIGLAVGEVQALLKNAKAAQLDMTYELVRDYEIFRMHSDHYLSRSCCRTMTFETQAYATIDNNNRPWNRRFGKWLSQLVTRDLFAKELVDETNEDDTERQMNILVEIQNEMRKLPKSKDDRAGDKQRPLKNQISKQRPGARS